MSSHNPQALVDKLEKSSDRLHLVHDKEHPAMVPRYAVNRIGELRQLHILPHDSKYVIVNTHGELAIDIAPSSEEDFTRLFSLIFDGGLSLSNGKTIVKEPEVETIDFYVLKPELNISERLRCYFQGGKYTANRTIVADLQDRKNIEWHAGDYKVEARSECVFILRESGKGNAVKDFENNWKDFFSRNKSITHIVYKKLHRGNFGEECIWDHRNAYCKSGSSIIDITQEESIIGMGDFISFSGQCVSKHQFSRRKSYGEFAELSEVLKRSLISPRDFYQSLTGDTGSRAFRIEVEARGEKFKPETAYLAKQLLDQDGFLSRAGVPYSVSQDRKISSRNRS